MGSSAELGYAIATILVIAISRVLSHFEHKKTNKKVGDIYIKVNGELEKKIKDTINEAFKKRDERE